MGSDKLKNADDTFKLSDHAVKEPEGLFKNYIEGAGTDEDTLFEINELLHAGKFDSTRKNVRAPLAIKVNFKIGNEEFLGESYTVSSRGIFIKHLSSSGLNPGWSKI